MASPAQIPPVRTRRSFAGPVVLIIAGVLLLLANMGKLPWRTLGTWFAHFWPVLIILWGIIKLIEYQQAQREGLRAPGIGVGGAFLLAVQAGQLYFLFSDPDPRIRVMLGGLALCVMATLGAVARLQRRQQRRPALPARHLRARPPGMRRHRDDCASC